MTSTTSSAPAALAVAPQNGERGLRLEEAWQHAVAAVADLGLTKSLDPVPAEDPGAWRCTLYRDGVPLPEDGSGKGTHQAARVGAVFEALEHHLSARLPPPEETRLCRPQEIAEGPQGADRALAMLAHDTDRPVACQLFQPVTSGCAPAELPVPLFLYMPDYLTAGSAARSSYGDQHDYTALGRYSMNNGWAAGSTPTEALVHALNEIVERDAMSLLLTGQFVNRAPAPLRVVTPESLPGELAALHEAAEARVGARVWLLEMTTELEVPAYWAYTPAGPGKPARVRGAGASLSPHYAVERALTELIQYHSNVTGLGVRPTVSVPQTAAHPALQRCYLADFSTRFPAAVPVPFVDAPAPPTPEAHLRELLLRLETHGFPAWMTERYVSDHLAVLNVFVPGMERFVLVSDGLLVLPGPRGLAGGGLPDPSPGTRGP